MENVSEELKQIWDRLNSNARKVLLMGRATLEDVQVLSTRADWSVRRMDRWIMRARSYRRDQITRRRPWIDRNVATLDELIGEVRQIAKTCLRVAKAFMESKLTLEQARYAADAVMGPRALRFFCQINTPDLIRARRKARAERWVSRFLDEADQPEETVQVLKKEAGSLISAGTPVSSIRLFLLSRTPPSGLAPVRV